MLLEVALFERIGGGNADVVREGSDAEPRGCLGAGQHRFVRPPEPTWAGKNQAKSAEILAKYSKLPVEVIQATHRTGYSQTRDQS
jgi:hypothetical protein